MENQVTGRIGEDYILAKLEQTGYRLLHRNFYVRGGEIDLILEKKGKLIFVEVKTRSGSDFGSPFDSITAKKRRHLRHAAEYYIQLYHLEGREMEFWGAAVFLDREGHVFQYEIVEDILA